jgi:lipopolysaccharide transport system ATP-binding protein
LEVGTGFSGELTGRENIYMNGAILGMKKAEIDRKFDEIVDFAGVDKFIDTPVKRYSSGMYVRLAFGVAAHLEPEILIVDEVLAVGDASFQAKCLNRMQDVGREGRTVLFVSHNMPAVLRLCPDAIMLKDGQMVMRGPSSAVIEHYMDVGAENHSEKVWRADEIPSSCGPFHPIAVRVCKANSTVTDLVSSSQPFSIDVEYELIEPIRNVRVQVKLYGSEGTHLLTSSDTDDPLRYKSYHVRQPGHYVSRCYIPANLLNNGVFMVGVSVAVPHVQQYFAAHNCVRFAVSADGVGSHWTEARGGLCRPALDWDIQRR